MTIASFKDADGGEHIVYNTFKDSDGTDYTLGNNFTDSDGNVFQIFFDLLQTTTPLLTGVVFTATDSRGFTATDTREFVAS